MARQLQEIHLRIHSLAYEPSLWNLLENIFKHDKKPLEGESERERESGKQQRELQDQTRRTKGGAQMSE